MKTSRKSCKNRKQEKITTGDSFSSNTASSEFEYLISGRKTILCVAEKNSVAKEIAHFLCPKSKQQVKLKSKSSSNSVILFPYYFNGNECNMIVTSVRGHLKQLEFMPQFSKWDSVSPEILLDLRTPVNNSVLPDCIEIVENLKYFSKYSTYLILWLDCDREGENIAFEVISICLSSNKNIVIFRAHFSAITNNEIEHAMNNLTSPNRALSDAVEARKEIDLRVGSSFTRFLTLRYNRIFPIPENTLSYGTCQFPTLGFVVNKYYKRLFFNKEDWWTIILNANLNSEKNNSGRINHLEFEWERGKIFDHSFVFIIYEKCVENSTAVITDHLSNEIKKKKPLPLNTVEMAKIASRKLKISPARCLKIAEDLYRKGYISYPRTETNIFPESIDVRTYIKKLEVNPIFGEFANKLLYLNGFSIPRKGLKDDGSHPPIYPVKNLNKEKASSNDEWLLYEFISRHFLAACSKDAIILETVIKVDVSEETFKIRGNVYREKNWLEIYSPYEKTQSKELPILNVGVFPFQFELNIRKFTTTPPSLLSEAELIDLMDRNGIGTDATMHEHIEKIQNRQYVKKNSQSLLSPTALGCALFKGFESISENIDLNNSLQINRDLNKLIEEDINFNLMHFQIRQIIERSITKISSGEHSRSFVVEQVVTLMRNIYNQMVTYIDRLDFSMSSFFPKWNKRLVLLNGNIVVTDISECGLCRSGVDIYEIKKNFKGLPPVSSNLSGDEIIISRNIKFAICKGDITECCGPLIVPSYEYIKQSKEYCSNCKYKKIEFTNKTRKKSICIRCHSFDNFDQAITRYS
ncbi:DNA topoisomerase family protein [Cryptosporidium felis]|nr:DNA topoisomerase family protein [Cryptosporidium felis]